MFGFAYLKIQSFLSHYFSLENLKLKQVKIQKKLVLFKVQQKFKKKYIRYETYKNGRDKNIRLIVLTNQQVKVCN